MNFAIKIKKFYTFFLLVTFAVFNSALIAQHNSFSKNGRVFSLNLYSFPNQLDIKKSYSISQNNLGVLFISTNSGIISFDGTDWGLIPFKDKALLINASERLLIFSAGFAGEILYEAPGYYSVKEISVSFPVSDWNPSEISASGDSIVVAANNKLWLFLNNRFSFIQDFEPGSYLTSNTKSVILHQGKNTWVLHHGKFQPVELLNGLQDKNDNQPIRFYNSSLKYSLIYSRKEEFSLKSPGQKTPVTLNFPNTSRIVSTYCDWNDNLWIISDNTLTSIKYADYFNVLEGLDQIKKPIRGIAGDSLKAILADENNIITVNPSQIIPARGKNLFISNLGRDIILVQADGLKRWENNTFNTAISRPIEFVSQYKDQLFFVSRNTLFSFKIVNNSYSLKELYKCKSDSIKKLIVKKSGDILMLDRQNRIHLLLASQKGISGETIFDPGDKNVPPVDNIFQLGDDLYASNVFEIFKLEGNNLKKQESFLQTLPSHGHFIDYLETDSLGNIWYTSRFPGEEKHLYYGKTLSNEKFAWYQIPIWEAGLKNPLILGHSQRRTYLFENGKLFVFDLQKFLSTRNNIKLIAQQILVNNKNKSLQFRKKGHSILPYFEVNYPANLINIKFKAIDLVEPRTIQYSFLLEKSEEDWSPWTSSPERYFSNLTSGNYKLLVRAQSINGCLSDTFSIRFKIIPPFYLQWYAWIGYVILFLGLLFYIGYRRKKQYEKERLKLENIIRERTSELTREKEKTDELLANLLPKDTADELKNTGKASSHKFDMVTVLFSDIQGFTKIAEQMNPEKLIDELDNFFFQFDSVVEKYNIEKIKTIGDAYMAAGGIPYKNRTNPVEVVLAALEMQEYMKALKIKNTDIWDLRIGIHTGAVIAGVVGHKRISYDIWGDTVNTASRMESSGEASKINISGQTYELVKEFFICEYRGKMPVKYKGDIDMYFVKGIRPELSVNLRSIPSKKFFIQLQLLRLLDLEEFIFNKLESELSVNLLFHNLKHTKDVYTQVELLGRAENITPEEMLLLRTAALFHDTGYIFGYLDHEIKSIDIAREILPKYKYTPDQIDTICEYILCTRKNFQPKNILEEILIDANFDYLGRVDFVAMALNQYKEQKAYNLGRSEKEWFLEQIQVLESHQFWTDTARRLREVSKSEQIQKIKEYLKLYV